MAKSSKGQSNPNVKDVVEKVGEESYNYRRIRSLYDSRLEYTGRVSGELYVWSKAGDEVSVLQDDVPELLSKRIGQRSCCGEGLLGNLVFEEAK